MKNMMIIMAAFAATVTACTNDAGEYMNQQNARQDPTEVVLTFGHYEMEEMTRAAVPGASPSGATTRSQVVSDFANKLDVWLYEGGSEVQQIQQESQQDGFGTIALTLDKRKTYTLYAVAHKSSGGHATLDDGIIAWPGDKISQTFYYTSTFTPAETTTLSCLMDRIVGMFRMETTDKLPTEAARATIDVRQTFTAWSIDDNEGTNPKDRTVNFGSLSPASDGSVALTAYILSTSEQPTDHTVTVTFLDANDNIVQQRTFADVPIRNGYRTIYRGALFTDQPMTADFTVADWQEYGTTMF